MTDTPEDIAKLREQLNGIDAQLLKLIGERRKVSTQTALTKASASLPIRDLGREEELLLERIKLGRELGLDPHLVTKFFHDIIDDSLRVQQDQIQKLVNGEGASQKVTRVAFHGIEGSYSYVAAQHYFNRGGSIAIFTGCRTFDDVAKAVETGQVDYGIVPIDNSLSGALSEVYELLLRSPISIVGEEKCKIEHCLMASKDVPLTSIKRVFCYPQAVTECRNFLTTLPGVHVEVFTDSATSARKIKEDSDPTQAAIGSDEAARIFGLKVLKREIGNQRDNFTRYLIVARNPKKVDLRIACKTSLVMATAQQPGALANVLIIFRDNQINLTKLESRPVADNPGEEMFYLDFEGNIEDGRIEQALQEVTRYTRYLKVLGCYPSFDLPQVQVSFRGTTTPSESVGANNTAGAAKPEPKPMSAKKGGYKLASREHKSEDTVIEVKGVKIGGPEFVVMAGPCSVESHEQINSCAREAKEHGAKILRGGCFKPRTSPYSFQGLGFDGLDMMAEAGRAVGMPIITEVMSEEDVEKVAERADILQIGARNMQNYSLLKAVGKTHRPVMLKRSLSAPIDELLQAVEYILAGGNLQVMLCERGIRTFETSTRYTLDISAVPVLKRRTHLPIIIDPSHAAGDRELVSPLALAAKAVGAHGIIVEFHPEPEKALSDGPQALRYPQFEKLMSDLFRV